MAAGRSSLGLGWWALVALVSLAVPAVAQTTVTPTQPKVAPPVVAVPGVVKRLPPVLVRSSCTAQNRDTDGDGADCIDQGGQDCDDTDRNRFPGNPEICDPADHDEDCDAATFGPRDVDRDGFADARCCNRDAAGVKHCGEDCQDAVRRINPNVPEVCNHVDDNCDGGVDGDGTFLAAFEDRDKDLFGDRARRVEICPQDLRPGLVVNDYDCDDADARKNPWAGNCP